MVMILNRRVAGNPQTKRGFFGAVVECFNFPFVEEGGLALILLRHECHDKKIGLSRIFRPQFYIEHLKQIRFEALVKLRT